MVKVPQSASPDAQIAGIDKLSYEQARSQLVEIVAQLEQGSLPLEDSLNLWERGEALARRCQEWLDGARSRLEASQSAGSEPVTQTSDNPSTHTPEIEEN